MEKLTVLTNSLSLAELQGNKELEKEAHDNLCSHYCSIGQYIKATEHQELCLAIAKQIGDRKGEESAYGDLGVCYYYLGQYDKAIEYQEMRLTMAKQIGDRNSEGIAYGNLGECYRCISQYKKAIHYQELRLKFAKDIGDKNGEGISYGNLGLCYQSLGEYGKAVQLHNKRLIIAKQTNNQRGEGMAYGNLGTCYHSLGQFEEAIKQQNMCLSIAIQTGNKGDEGRAYGNLGTCYDYLGQYNKAIEYLEKRLIIAKQIGDKKGEGTAHGNLGASYRSLGQYDKAIEHQEVCLIIAKQIGDKRGEGIANGNLGNCYVSLGMYEKAIEHHNRSLLIAEEIKNKSEEGTAHGGLGTCYRFLSQYEKAIEHFKTSLTITKEIGDKNGEGTVHGKLGECYYSLRQYEKTLEHHNMCLTIAKQVGNKSLEGTAYCNFGNCFDALGQCERAIEHHNMHLSIAEQTGEKGSEGEAHGNLGACYHSLEQYDAAERHLRKSVECYEKLFENVPKLDELKVSILDTFKSTHRLLIKNMLLQDKTNEALICAEMGRSRALPDLMVTSHPFRYSTGTNSKISDIHELFKVVKALGSTVLFYALLPPEICTWIIQPNGEMTFEKHFNAVTQKTKKNLNSLVKRTIKLMTTDPEDMCEDRSLAFLYPEGVPNAGKKSTCVMPAGATPADLAFSKQKPFRESSMTMTTPSTSSSMAQGYDNQAELGNSLLSLLKDFYHILLEPVRQCVKESKAVVVSDGPLSMVPFAALIDANGCFVADSLHVRLVPSLASAKMIKEHDEERPNEEISLILGDPDVGEVEKGDEVIPVPRLPGANQEVQLVGRLLNVRPLVAEQATKETFLQKVGSASLIHIASHGDAERGELLLAPLPGIKRSRLQDVLVTISDLERKRTRAKLVVLSCCHTGRGDVRAEGVVGIARAFLGAGARAVLVTLWAVHDKATLFFMEEFYHHLIVGETASKALNRAMRTMKEVQRFRHPRYWAPFVLLGDDVTLSKQ